MTTIPIPSKDGDVNEYNLSNSGSASPRIYFVNGIQVLPNDHAVTAAYLSLIVERPIWGVYNQTAGIGMGIVNDLGQCLLDYMQNAGARLSSRKNLGKPSTIPEEKIPDFLNNLERKYIVWNQATLRLFKELVSNRKQRQLIIAHSQGNLITSNALFSMEDVFGADILKNIRVYSLASPSPAWPVGLRHTEGGGGRQENAFMNDLVALLRPHNALKKHNVVDIQNAGDFRMHPKQVKTGTEFAHNAREIIKTLNFLKSIRSDLGLPKEIPDEFLDDSWKKASGSLQMQP